MQRNHHLPRSRTESGFTLIEMLTVLAVLGILAGLIVPSLLSRRITANESAVISTMKTIAQAQFQFKTLKVLDQDKDTNPEFAMLPELAGSTQIRGGDARINKSLLSSHFGLLDSNGHVARHGYLFCLYLPASDGEGVVATPDNASVIDPKMSTDYYTLVAWPFALGKTGEKTFFINQRAEILRTRFGVYSGKSNVPPPGAGLTGVKSSHINTQNLANDSVGADGSLWISVN